MKADIGHGSNPCLQHYQVSEGHPHYEPQARFLGNLTGSWYDIGQQVGEQAGDLVRWVSDVWWQHHLGTYGLSDTMQAMDLYEAQIAALSTSLIEFMQGVADGASTELDRSPHAQQSSHYQKVLNTNIFDAWSWRQPTPLPWKEAGTTLEGAQADAPLCSSFVTLGQGPNRDDVMIATHNRHCPFNPKCYQIAYVGQPSDGNAYWTLTPGGAGSGCQIVNDRGVSLILNAGGNKHSALSGNAFGVPWFVLFLHVAAYANTASEAIEMITQGTSEYRANTGRNSLLRTGTWNFLISDRTECAVVETSCDRYAIRRPGDLGEIGNYLVMTNHNYCDHSFNENNQRTDVPMSQFGNEGTSEGSAKRFWTLMWDIRHHFGEIDVPLAMQLMQGHHQYDQAGNRVESTEGEAPLQFQGDVTCPHGDTWPETWERGSADAKVAVADEDTTVYWTLGRPCEWEGPWDRVVL